MTVTGKLYFFVSGTYRNQLRNIHLFFRVCVIHRLFKVNIRIKKFFHYLSHPIWNNLFTVHCPNTVFLLAEYKFSHNELLCVTPRAYT